MPLVTLKSLHPTLMDKERISLSNLYGLHLAKHSDTRNTNSVLRAVLFFCCLSLNTIDTKSLEEKMSGKRETISNPERKKGILRAKWKDILFKSALL